MMAGSFEANLDNVQLFEIKSTNKKGIGPDFRKYCFGLTAAEGLVAQSLKKQSCLDSTPIP